MAPAISERTSRYDTAILWTGNGSMRVTNDNVVSADSQLSGVPAALVRYQTDCPGCDEGNAVNGPALLPANNELVFTRDGGLVERQLAGGASRAMGPHSVAR